MAPSPKVARSRLPLRRGAYRRLGARCGGDGSPVSDAQITLVPRRPPPAPGPRPPRHDPPRRRLNPPPTRAAAQDARAAKPCPRLVTDPHGHQDCGTPSARQDTACGMPCASLWEATNAATATCCPSRPKPRGPRCGTCAGPCRTRLASSGPAPLPRAGPVIGQNRPAPDRAQQVPSVARREHVGGAGPRRAVSPG